MRYDILLSVLFELLRERRLTAGELAARHGLSPRTIYRYIRRLADFLPLEITQGRRGGVCLADNYRLPVGFLTEEEYAATEEALVASYAATAEERFLSAKRKLCAAKKEIPPSSPVNLGDVLFFPSFEGDALATNLRLLRQAIAEKSLIRLLRNKSESAQAEEERARLVEPYALAFQGGEWLLYAYCHERKDFHFFPLWEIKGIVRSEEYFHPRPSILL